MNRQWPELAYNEAKDTYETLHMWTQIIGKIKLTKQPWINHSWHVTLAVTPTGLTTSGLMHEDKHFQIDFDLIQHKLKVTTNTRLTRMFDLQGLSVAGFYENVTRALNELNISIDINLVPNEVENAIPFDKDKIHVTYHPKHATALHKALLNAQHVFTQFRSEFSGKCSPVHFFWGGLDLAVSRFSGREAPMHPGGIPNLPDRVAREAYSHEVSSCGFWPGNESVPFAAFYSYIYPEPEGFKDFKILPEEAYYHPDLGEFILPYSVVQEAEDPSSKLLEFLRSTYEAAADLAGWDRSTLEKNMFRSSSYE
ncbi:hypothetical protein GZH53_06310 [Flavihumibacter sp. R14]|nr:hypothetical protein [Flavihumibacter soli]